MKIGSQIRKGCHERLKLAVEQDNSIIASPADVANHGGYPAEYFYQLGLTQGDLLKLERVGLAVRGYTKNMWLPGETLPKRGGVVPEGQTFRANGHRVRWVLVAREFS